MFEDPYSDIDKTLRKMMEVGTALTGKNSALSAVEAIPPLRPTNDMPVQALERAP